MSLHPRTAVTIETEETPAYLFTVTATGQDGAPVYAVGAVLADTIGTAVYGALLGVDGSERGFVGHDRAEVVERATSIYFAA